MFELFFIDLMDTHYGRKQKLESPFNELTLKISSLLCLAPMYAYEIYFGDIYYGN